MPYTPIDHPQVMSNLEAIRRSLADALIRGGRLDACASDITIVAATKYLDVDGVSTLVRAGITDVGENRLDALTTKQRGLAGDGGPHPVRWHWIGRLQSRKVDTIAGLVGTIHTLCSDSAAQRLRSLADIGIRMPQVFVQVNVDGDASKDGVEISALDGFLEGLPRAVQVDGLMTMPALAGVPEDSRAAFSALREARDRSRDRWGGRHALTHLSMGTSQDFGVAVEEGATVVRLGTVLYASQTISR